MKATPIILLLLAGACAPEVPAEPTWVDDVRPILAANCIRCHSPPYIGGAHDNFRLDKWADEPLPDSPFEMIRGAGGEAPFIAADVEDELMPPRTPLTGRQIDVLVTWADVGAPQGAPRPDNSLPTMTVSGEIAVADDRVGMKYEIEDADGDIVTGLLVAVPDGGPDPELVVSNELFVGRGSVVGALSSGSYQLIARLDDGNLATGDEVEVDLGTVVVP